MLKASDSFLHIEVLGSLPSAFDAPGASNYALVTVLSQFPPSTERGKVLCMCSGRYLVKGASSLLHIEVLGLLSKASDVPVALRLKFSAGFLSVLSQGKVMPDGSLCVLLTASLQRLFFFPYSRGFGCCSSLMQLREGEIDTREGEGKESDREECWYQTPLHWLALCLRCVMDEVQISFIR